MILTWLPVNLWASVDRSVSWQASGYLLFGITIYFACVNSPISQKYPQIIVWALLLCTSLLALASPFLVVLKPFRLFWLPLYDYLQSITLNIGETIHLNVLAGALVLALPFGASVTLYCSWTKRYWLRLLYRTNTLFLLAVVIITQSRGGYLATIAALSLVCMIRWPRLLYMLIVFVILLGLSIWRSGMQPLLEIFGNNRSLEDWHGRIEIWTQSLNAFYDFVFTGLGIGTFTLVIPLLYPLKVAIDSYPHAHNLFLQVALDLGIPGLIAYLALLINVGAMLVVTLRKAPRHTMVYSLAVGAAGSFAGMLTHGLLDAVTWGTKLSFLPWLLFALITQLFLQVQEDEQLSTL